MRRKTFELTKEIELLKAASLVLISLKRLSFQYLTPLYLILDYKNILNIDKKVYPLFGLVFINLIFLFINPSLDMLLRSTQLISIIFCLNLLISKFSLKELNYFLYSMLIIASIYTLNDLISSNYIESYKSILTIPITRIYFGIIGEPNYTAILLGLASIISLQLNKKPLSFLFFVNCIPAASRTVLLMFFVFFISKLVLKFSPKLLKAVKIPFLVLLFTTPLLYPTILENVNKEQKLKINIFSSERFDLQTAYATIIRHKPLGLGYMQGKKELEVSPYGFYKKLDHHNIYLQFLSEFGFLGGILFLIFLSIFYDMHI